VLPKEVTEVITGTAVTGHHVHCAAIWWNRFLISIAAGTVAAARKPSSQQAAASPEAERHAGLLDVRSRITTDITKIDQHPTDAWTSRRPPGALIEGPDKTSGLSNRWCVSDEIHSAATVSVTLTQRDGCKRLRQWPRSSAERNTDSAGRALAPSVRDAESIRQDWVSDRGR
jgi:hypothetical protein